MFVDVNDKKALIAFFKSINVEYIEKNVIKKSPIFYGKNYIEENSEEFRSLEYKYGTPIKNGYKPKLSIKESNIAGLGLWTETQLKKGDYVGQYVGIQKFASFFNKNTDYSFLIPAPTFPKLEIDSRLSGNELRFANHSWTPNLVSDHIYLDNKWIIFFYAAEDIKPNVELTINYGDDYFATTKREVLISEEEFLNLKKLIPAENRVKSK